MHGDVAGELRIVTEILIFPVPSAKILRARYCVPTVDIPGREGGSRESFDPNLASH